MGAATGGSDLGCSLVELPPGEASAPYHYHHGNEEALYVLSGEGTLRVDTGETDLSAGDYVAFPTGERGAHHVNNPSDEPLRYLIFSTMRDPDIVVYPEMNSIGLFTGAAPGSHPDEFTFQRTLQADAEVEYKTSSEE